MDGRVAALQWSIAVAASKESQEGLRGANSTWHEKSCVVASTPLCFHFDAMGLRFGLILYAALLHSSCPLVGHLARLLLAQQTDLFNSHLLAL